MKNLAVKYAVTALVITIVWTLIEHFLGYNTTKHEMGQYARLLGAFVFYFYLFFAMHAVRKQGGSLSFGEGFKTGAVLSAIYSIGVGVWYALYGEVINTQYKPTLMAFERSKLEAANASPETIAEKMKQVDMTTGGSVLSYLLLVLFMFLIGCVVAAIAALILKRKRRVVV